MPQDLYIIAVILRPHGLKGEVRLRPETDSIETLMGAKRVFLGLEGKRTVKVEKTRLYKESPFMKLEGIDDIDSAENLRNIEVCLPREELTPLEEGEYFLHDLVGLSVFDHGGTLLGKVEGIMDTGSSPVLLCNGDKGEFLIPFSADAVGEVDLEGKILHLLDLPGLLEI